MRKVYRFILSLYSTRTLGMFSFEELLFIHSQKRMKGFFSPDARKKARNKGTDISGFLK